VTEARTTGDVLRAARRRRRVSIERAAEETRIRADFLMRMESDEFDFLAPAYVRGFLRNYARWLGIGPDPLLAAFDKRYGTGQADTGQIAALERRARSAPRQRRKLSSWAVAATIASLLLVALAAIGLTQAPEESDQPGLAEAGGGDDGAGRTPSDEGSPSPSPTPERKRQRKKLALAQGMEVEVVAKRAECWVSVQADGVDVYTSSPSLQVGDRVGPFRANESMDIVLGNPYGVDLIINGSRFGPLGEAGLPITVNLPEDVKSLL
jgi:cytoskeleton protein RodZ